MQYSNMHFSNNWEEVRLRWGWVAGLIVLALCVAAFALRIPANFMPLSAATPNVRGTPSRPTATKVDPTLSNMSAEDQVAYASEKAGKSAWEVDCDRAFMGNLEAAKRVKEAIQAMPYGQRSERADSCAMIAATTIKMGGYKP
ncbi:MAG: hypothetical protein ACOY45_00900 [Pseudomonadota bacterium]